MALKIVPLPAQSSLTPFFTETISLDGVPYQFDFRWNHRLLRWTFNILLPNGEEIVTGRTLVTNWDLLTDLGPALVPPGQLIYFRADAADAGLDNLAEGTLYYEEEDDG